METGVVAIFGRPAQKSHFVRVHLSLLTRMNPHV